MKLSIDLCLSSALLRRASGLVFAAAIAAVVGAGYAGAGERVNIDESSVAILGYDAVAYHTVGAPTEGSPEFEYVWNEARWLFSSAEHQEMFAAEPQRYAPRYGGFCAGAMALGFRARIDPEAWAIIDGNLFLAYDRDGIEDFEEESDTQVPRADANWVRLGQAE